MFDEQVRDWLDRAKRDLEKAKSDFERGWLPESCFHSQQATEKALKAFLRSRGVVVRGHRIEKLLKLSTEYGLKADDLLIYTDRLSDLSDQYGAPRYPNFMGKKRWKLEDYDKSFSASCLDLATEVLRRVEGCLKR